MWLTVYRACMCVSSGILSRIYNWKWNFFGAKANSFSWLFGSLFHMHTAFSWEKKEYFCWHIFALHAESNEWCVHYLWLNVTARTHSLSFNGLCRNDTRWNIWYQIDGQWIYLNKFTELLKIVVKFYKSFLFFRRSLREVAYRRWTD